MLPLLSLILAATIVMGSPGPSTISLTAVGAAFGLRRSLAYGAGLVLGTFAVLLAVTTGLISLLASVPQAAPGLLALSAAYILYLAYRIATAPPLSKHDAAVAAPSPAGGFLLAIANPKAYVAIAAVFAGSPLDPVPKAMVLAVMVALIHAFWLLAGASFSRLFYDPKASRIVNIALAAALVATTALAVLP